MAELTDENISREFYNSFNYQSPIKISLFMIFSLGFYFINWIFIFNRKFKELNLEYAPNPFQGLKFMFLVPFVWLVTMGVLKRIYEVLDYSVLFWLDVVGWLIIMVMMLEYLYRFCICFGRFTNTSGFIWYLFLWVGFFPLALIPFGKFFFLPILFFSLFTVPVMQMKLNSDSTYYLGFVD